MLSHTIYNIDLDLKRLRNNVIGYALSQAKLNSHRGDRLKRKISGEQEDREMKRRMLTLMEDSSRHSQQCLDKMNDNMAEITGCIKDGFALMRDLCLQPQPSASYFAQPQSSSAGHGEIHGHPTALMVTTPQPTTPAAGTNQGLNRQTANTCRPEDLSYRRALLQEDAE